LEEPVLQIDLAELLKAKTKSSTTVALRNLRVTNGRAVIKTEAGSPIDIPAIDLDAQNINLGTETGIALRADVPQLNGIADLAVKAIRWGVSEMGLLLVADGRDCPGCDSPQRFCLGPQTDIQCPGNLRATDVVRSLGQIVNANGAFGPVSESAFFLDPTQLGDLSRNRVIDLLNATGTALRNLGHPVDTSAGIKAANQVFGIS
jgi:hypothetical protein